MYLCYTCTCLALFSSVHTYTRKQRFQKVPFLLIVFIGYVWTEAVSVKKKLRFQEPRRGWGSPPTFLAVDVRTLNGQLEIFKVLMKDGEFTCFDDILAKIKQLSEAENCMVT